MSAIFATTDRLILRDFRPADLPLYIELSTDPEVMRYMGGPRSAAYREEQTLFGPEPKKVPYEEFAEWFRQRLIHKAGFKHVPKPMPMKTRNNAVIYYLYFASQKPAAMQIVNDIFRKYGQR